MCVPNGYILLAYVTNNLRSEFKYHISHNSHKETNNSSDVHRSLSQIAENE